MESCAALSNSGTDVQYAASECRQDVSVQPRLKYRSLRWVAAFSQQYTDLQLLVGDH
jgi:hypothetical protein